MTDAATLDHETLYITDAELIRRMGVPEKIARLTDSCSLLAGGSMISARFAPTNRANFSAAFDARG